MERLEVWLSNVLTVAVLLGVVYYYTRNGWLALRIALTTFILTLVVALMVIGAFTVWVPSAGR